MLAMVGEVLLSQADVAGSRWLRMTGMNPLMDDTTVNRIPPHIETLD